jgi:hypothetical protein
MFIGLETKVFDAPSLLTNEEMNHSKEYCDLPILVVTIVLSMLRKGFANCYTNG